MKWKHLIRYPMAIRRAQACLSVDRGPQSLWPGPVIALDLYTDQMLFDCGRHLACIAASTQKLRGQLILRCDRMMLAAIAHKSLGKSFLQMSNVSWVPASAELPEAATVMSDVNFNDIDRPLSGQALVSMKIGRDRAGKARVMPYPMHPDQILSLDDDRLSALRDQPKAGVFFAGSQKSRYGRERMRDEFGVMPRLEVLEVLRNRFSDRLESRHAEGGHDRIVLRDSATDPIPGGDWMSVVASHRFFLCCPGASQPICHHLVEAMSVGVIPIIEYGDRLDPELADGVNAIRFTGAKGLIDAVDRIGVMPEAEMVAMSQRVGQYFDQALRGDRALQKLIESVSKGGRCNLSMPFHDRNLFVSEDSGRALGSQANGKAA